MKRPIIKTTFIFFLIFLFSCDTDRFFGYNHEADEQLESTNVFGNVTNTFTGEAVEKASIKIGNTATRSDKDGNYFTKYPLREDDNRDAAVPVTIKMPQYYEFEDAVVLYPLSNEYNFELVYAAPIIVRSTIGTLHPDMIFGPPFIPPMYCQAHIRDYQGIETVTKVTVIVNYSNDVTKPIEYELVLIKKISRTDAYYQFKVPLYIPQYGVIEYEGSYSLHVYDDEGYIEKVTKAILPELILFPPK